MTEKKSTTDQVEEEKKKASGNKTGHHDLPKANEQPDIKRTEHRDHPEQYPTDKDSLFDLHESQQNVDPLPLEDIKMELREEKHKDKTKNNSSSDQKYKSGFEKKD